VNLDEGVLLLDRLKQAILGAEKAHHGDAVHLQLNVGF